MQPDQLRAIRKGLGLTQGDLGAALGVTKEFVNMMENDRRGIEPRTALAVRYLALRPRIEAYQAGVDQMAETGAAGAASASAALDHVMSIMDELEGG